MTTAPQDRPGRSEFLDQPRSALERAVFSTADRTYRWQDVLDAGREWGDLALLERRLAEGLAALARADDEGHPLEEAGVDVEADGFRHTHGLLAAEEMEAWLARWDLDPADWFAYLRRTLARERPGGELDETLARYEPAPQRVAEAVWAQAVCSGALARWAWKLAGRVAAADSLGVPPDSDLAALEHASDERASSELTSDARTRTLETKRSDWTRVECTVLELPEEGMAREAILSVRDDGMTLREVAVQAGAAVVERTYSMEGTEPDLARALLCASTGDVLGPLTIETGFALIAVHEKRPPSLDEPEVERRVEEEIRRRTIDAEIGSRIRWHERL